MAVGVPFLKDTTQMLHAWFLFAFCCKECWHTIPLAAVEAEGNSLHGGHVVRLPCFCWLCACSNNSSEAAWSHHCHEVPLQTIELWHAILKTNPQLILMQWEAFKNKTFVWKTAWGERERVREQQIFHPLVHPSNIGQEPGIPLQSPTRDTGTHILEVIFWFLPRGISIFGTPVDQQGPKPGMWYRKQALLAVA